MWPGPYGEWGSRKYLLASLDQSLRRMGLDYVDIFYSHRFDPETPLEETMGALVTAVRSRARAVRRHLVVLAGAHRGGRRAAARRGRPAADPPAVVLAAQPLGRGRPARHPRGRRRRLHHLLAARPGDAHRQVPRRDPGGVAGEQGTSLDPALLDERNMSHVRSLAAVAAARGQSLAQMALLWTLRDPRVTSTLVGASSVAPAGGQRGRAGRAAVHRRRAGRDRPLRRRGRDQPVGPVQRRSERSPCGGARSPGRSAGSCPARRTGGRTWVLALEQPRRHRVVRPGQRHLGRARVAGHAGRRRARAAAAGRPPAGAGRGRRSTPTTGPTRSGGCSAPTGS